ncbi:Clp protease N-terminal domain-containing protein [Massilia violaceinigra]|uniref:Clp protease N-terminal domain-containing protein n=1 Tax=Massilia violaceinigra TaxID=2045208 RepID=A0ABY4AC00_9BURK|nr:Clp protease N-terminal domain-containing protein [Massilia violaceinigra]UOD32127.1 Clp protease N-terminal domain-containing protein [Massilia violaceinigra]
MFQRLRQRLGDMKTIQHLCRGAEKYALADQQREPAAEHFLLSALDLDDGTARRAFAQVDADPARLPQAIAQQYRDGLRFAGVAPGAADDALLAAAPLAHNRGLYRAAPSGADLMQALAQRRADDRGPLLGAHVVALVAAMRQGVAPRSLAALGVDAAALSAAALAEISAHRKA